MLRSTCQKNIQWFRLKFCLEQRSITLTLINLVRLKSFNSPGRICLDILKDKWSPALQIRSVLLSVQALMSAPNLDDPLDEEIADHWRKDEEGAIKKGTY